MTISARPPEEVVESWRERAGQTLTSWSWQDVAAQQHAAAFTVAKGMQADVVRLLASTVDKAIIDGWTTEQFVDSLEPRLAEAGWWGRQPMRDPLTGKVREVMTGSVSRLELILQTNARTAYARGRWQQAQRLKERGHYLQYLAVMDEDTREAHASWHGTILPVDHPWWETHYPLNGWRCRCRTRLLSPERMEAEGLQPSSPPPDRTIAWTNQRTGEIQRVPWGIDPGWDHNVGTVNPEEAANAALGQKLAALPASLREALAATLAGGPGGP